jgi:hypothetical protein
MSVCVELRNGDGAAPVVGDLRCICVTMSRVPQVHEIVRVLRTVNGLTVAFWFQITRVVHNAGTDLYPLREHQLDAYVGCVQVHIDL